jgi:hypothetical protein
VIETKKFKLVSINPSLVLGPLITPTVCKSLQVGLGLFEFVNENICLSVHVNGVRL